MDQHEGPFQAFVSFGHQPPKARRLIEVRMPPVRAGDGSPFGMRGLRRGLQIAVDLAMALLSIPEIMPDASMLLKCIFGL